MLSANASTFYPSSVLSREEDHNGIVAVIKQKKTKEMRGPRKRHRKKKTTFSADYSHYEGVEDDTISYLSLETGSDSAYNNLDYTDNHYINNGNNNYSQKNTAPHPSMRNNTVLPFIKQNGEIHSTDNSNGDQGDHISEDFSVDAFDTDDITTGAECTPLREECRDDL